MFFLLRIWVYVLALLRRVVKPSSGRKVAGERLTEGEREKLGFAIALKLRILPQSHIRSTGLAAARARSGLTAI